MIEELCGGDDSLCCIEKKGKFLDSEQVQVKTTRFAKHDNDDKMCKVISERIPRNTINQSNSVLKLSGLREISINNVLT